MARARVEITATNNIQKGLNASKKQLSGYQQYVMQMGDKIKKALSFTAIATAAVAGIKTITSACKQCVSAFSEAEKVSSRLNAVWKNVGTATGKTAKQMDDFAESMEKVTYFASESIKEAGLLLAATESLTEDGFDRALQASMDLAAALGEDVTSAAQTLSKAIQEPESALSRLKTIGVSFTEDEKAQIKALTDANKKYEAQALILDKIEQKYRGVAQAINDTPVGLLDNINDTISDIRKDLGEGLLNALSPVLEDIYGWLQSISDWVYQWGHEGKTKDFDSHYSSFIGSNIKGLLDNGIGGIEDYRELEKFFDDYNYLMSGGDQSPFALSVAEILKADEDFLRDMKKLVSEANDQVNEYYSDIADAVNKAWTEGQISSDRMAQLIRDDLELEGDAISKEVREFFEGLLSDWETVLSPAAIASNRASARASISDYVTANGNKSVSYQIAQLTEQITDAWNNWNKATSLNMDTEAGYIMEVINNLEDQKKKLTEIDDDVVKEMKTFIDKFGENLANLVPASWGTSEQASAGIGKVLGNATESFGEAGELISELAQNMATMGPVIGAIVTALKYVIEGLAETIGPLLEDVVAYGLEPLREIGRVIGDLIKPLLEELMPLFKDSAESFISVINEIGAALKPVISLIATAIRPILDQLRNTLKFIEPVIKVISKVLVSFTGVIEYIGQVLTHWVATILNWLAGLNLFGWKPFEGLRITDPGAPGNFSEFMDKRYSAIESAGESATMGTSSQLAVSSASYRGATSVTINIYQEGPLVGDGGMRQFAEMIREEFDALNYYGVSA